MRKTSSGETLLRHWAMLRVIPRAPRRISVSQIHQRLEEDGFITTRRTIERDLIKLSSPFPLTSDDNKPQGWAWAKEAKILEIPSMGPQTALTLQMLAHFSEHLMPRSTLKFLQPHIDLADKVLKNLSLSPVTRWPDKIRVIHTGPLLIPPIILPKVLDRVYLALLEEHRFLAEYWPINAPTARSYEINPLGLVFKDALAYLVCTYGNEPIIKQFALHRFQSVETLPTKRTVPDGFSLDSYIQEGAFGYPEGGPIHLKARLAPGIIRYLIETPLSSDQKVTEMQDGWFLVEALVQESSQLRWWILSFAEALEVLEPLEFRSEIEASINEMARLYNPNGQNPEDG